MIAATFSGAHLVAVIVLLVVLVVLVRAHVEITVRKYRAYLDTCADVRREYRAELAARRPPRIRGCTCDACHNLTPVVPGRRPR